MFNIFIACIFWNSPTWSKGQPITSRPVATTFVVILCLLTLMLRHIRTKIMERRKVGASASFNNIHHMNTNMTLSGSKQDDANMIGGGNMNTLTNESDGLLLKADDGTVEYPSTYI